MKHLTRPNWWGGRGHKIFTVTVFVILASLDNAARTVFPPLYAVMARSLSVPEASLGLVTALSIVIVAITAVIWGFWGDRSSRKRLLLYGTLIWSVAMYLTGIAPSYSQLMLFQLITAVGIGSTVSVGFSMVIDFIPPQRRGLMLSLWGLSQGAAGGGGSLLGSLLGAHNWRLPFLVVAGAGLVLAVLYLFTYEPQRGLAEPALARVFASGRQYTHRIRLADMRQILARRTNVWLILQSFVATLAFGSLVWRPRLFIARVEAAGYGLETATMVGNMLSLLFETGFYFAILAGHLGDRWQQRNPQGRALISMISVYSSIPFNVALFLLPLPGLVIPEEAGLGPMILATLTSFFTNGWVATAFFVALVAVALSVADSPNRAALIGDVNLPEHRGTAAGLNTLASGLGLAIGNALAGSAFGYLASHFAPPMNFAIGLVLFQLFLIPAGWCYYLASKTSPGDVAAVRQTLFERAKLTA